MKKTVGVVSVLGRCQDCEWESSNYRNAQATSAMHAKTHKHLVWCEVAIDCTYDGKS